MTKTNEQYEYLSAMMDGDAVSEEMLDKLLADEQAQKMWYEYHVVRDYTALKSNEIGRDAEFLNSASFKAQLAEISAEHQSRSSAAKPLQTKAANHNFRFFAVAASVAAVAVSVWQFGGSERTEPQTAAVEQTAPKQAADHIVPVSTPEKRAASEPVMPNSAVKDLPAQQSAVRVEQADQPKQEVVQ